MKENELNKIRNKINAIDNRIRKLLEERFSLAVSAIAFKKNIKDPAREKEVMRNIQKGLKDRELKICFKKIYSEILRQSVEFQIKNANKSRR